MNFGKGVLPRGEQSKASQVLGNKRNAYHQVLLCVETEQQVEL